jgi:hypothetical protein
MMQGESAELIPVATGLENPELKSREPSSVRKLQTALSIASFVSSIQYLPNFLFPCVDILELIVAVIVLLVGEDPALSRRHPWGAPVVQQQQRLMLQLLLLHWIHRPSSNALHNSKKKKNTKKKFERIYKKSFPKSLSVYDLKLWIWKPTIGNIRNENTDDNAIANHIPTSVGFCEGRKKESDPVSKMEKEDIAKSSPIVGWYVFRSIDFLSLVGFGKVLLVSFFIPCTFL